MTEDCFHLGAKALIQNPEGKLLLLLLAKKKIWDLPGGRLQRGESLEEALRREVFEETGLENITRITPFITELSAIRIPYQQSDVGLIYSVFYCDLLTFCEIRLSDEHIDFGWFTPSEAAMRLVTYPERLLKNLTSKKSPDFFHI